MSLSKVVVLYIIYIYIYCALKQDTICNYLVESTKISTKLEHLRDMCLFSAMSCPEKIAIENERFYGKLCLCCDNFIIHLLSIVYCEPF